MDLQTVSSTYAQRNFSKLLNELDRPVTVLRDSEPEAVIIDYDEYLRMKRGEEKRKDAEFFEMLDKIHARNAHIPEEEVEKDVEEALRYVRSRRRGH